jgi:antitoxin ParD1/3/4
MEASMNVSLTPELERRISEKVESGLYTTASEVVREGLRLLFREEEIREDRLAKLRAEIAVGIEQAERGELIPGEQSRREMLAWLDAEYPLA